MRNFPNQNLCKYVGGPVHDQVGNGADWYNLRCNADTAPVCCGEESAKQKGRASNFLPLFLPWSMVMKVGQDPLRTGCPRTRWRDYIHGLALKCLSPRGPEGGVHRNESLDVSAETSASVIWSQANCKTMNNSMSMRICSRDVS